VTPPPCHAEIRPFLFFPCVFADREKINLFPCAQSQDAGNRDGTFFSPPFLIAFFSPNGAQSSLSIRAGVRLFCFENISFPFRVAPLAECQSRVPLWVAQSLYLSSAALGTLPSPRSRALRGALSNHLLNRQRSEEVGIVDPPPSFPRAPMSYELELEALFLLPFFFPAVAR